MSIIKEHRDNIGKTIIFLVCLYQKIPHPKLCKFEPSCSAYMILAVKKYGGVKGFFKGISRIFRCNPFFKGGIDYP
jgi:putative membrane protein insertion efficiency factor